MNLNFTFKNLTPHVINIIENNAVVRTFPHNPNDPIPRCSSSSVRIMDMIDIPLYQTVFGEVENLPDQTPTTFLIVSALVRTQLPTRLDLISPSQLVRDDAGVIIGCKGFDTNF